MKPVGWTFQTPNPSASAAPEDVAELDAGRRRGGPTPTSGESASLSAKAAAQGSSETSAAEVNSRINRILMIVKSPSTAKEDGDDGHQRNGQGRAKARPRRGGGGNNAGNWGDASSGGGGNRRGGKRGGPGANKSGNNEAGNNGKALVKSNGATQPQQRTPAEGTSAEGQRSLGTSKAGRGRSGGNSNAPATATADATAAVGSDAGADTLADTADPSEGGSSQPTNLNPHAPIFVPNSGDVASQEYYGYADTDWSYMAGGYWRDQHATDEQLFPEVILGSREDQFIGLQCIAEMGDWVVLREHKPKCLPFFWNRSTGEKTWEEPPSIKDMGVADLLKKWSVDLPESGIEPGPEAWPQPVREQHRGAEQRRGSASGRRGQGRGSAAAAQHTVDQEAGGGAAGSSAAPRSSAPPGFDGPPAARNREADNGTGAVGAGSGGGARPSKAGRSTGSHWRPKAVQGSADCGGPQEEVPRSGKEAVAASGASHSTRARGASEMVWQPKAAASEAADALQKTEQQEPTSEPAPDETAQE